MGTQVTVLNACGTPLCTIPWQRAVTLLVAKDAKGQPVATVFEADEERMIRSQHLTIPWPKAIQLTKYVYVKFARDADSTVSKKGVLRRDKFTCAYCGDAADTVDHVMPESRGGRSTWENLVSACGPCNWEKADRTPEEAKMRLLFQPRRPNNRAKLEKAQWKKMAASGIR